MSTQTIDDLLFSPKGIASLRETLNEGTAAFGVKYKARFNAADIAFLAQGMHRDNGHILPGRNPAFHRMFTEFRHECPTVEDRDKFVFMLNELILDLVRLYLPSH